MKQKLLSFTQDREVLIKQLESDRLDYFNLVFLTSEKDTEDSSLSQYIIIEQYPTIGSGTDYRNYRDWVEKNISVDKELLRTESEGYRKINYNGLIEMDSYKPE